MSKGKLYKILDDDLPFYIALDEAKKDFPKKNSNPRADSFKVQEEFEDAVLDWFEKWFGDDQP